MILRSYSLKERTANASFFFPPSQPQKNFCSQLAKSARLRKRQNSSLCLSLSLSVSCSLSYHDTLQHNEAQRKELTSDSGFEPSTFFTSLHFSAIQGGHTLCILGFVVSRTVLPGRGYRLAVKGFGPCGVNLTTW